MERVPSYMWVVSSVGLKVLPLARRSSKHFDPKARPTVVVKSL